VFVVCRSDAKFPKGNIEEPLCPSWYLIHPVDFVVIETGNDERAVDFMVIETGNDERAPIILGRPFLNTS